MESRYTQLKEAGVDDLRQYNSRSVAGRLTPRIVCVCDEYADLLLGGKSGRRDLEQRVARLGAKARAAGIHLVLATQRPSRDIVTGVIDANLVARVALKVARAIESQIILEDRGAATLLGKGDLLFRDIGKPVRLQSPLVEAEDLRALR